MMFFTCNLRNKFYIATIVGSPPRDNKKCEQQLSVDESCATAEWINGSMSR